MDKATLNWLKIAERDLKAAKIHNLKRLAVECCKIKLEKHREEVLVKLDKSFIDSRYPEDFDEVEKTYDLRYCLELLKEVEVTFLWLKDLLMKN